MSEWRAKFKFSTVATFAGEETVIAADPGDLLRLDEGVAEFLLRDMPGCIVKPRMKTAKPEDGAKTRQITDAPKRGKKKG